MQEIYSTLRTCWLFHGLTEEEIQIILGCISGKTQTYQKQEILFHTGDAIRRPGIVLLGELYLFREDFWGNQTILSNIRPGELFGEVFACLPDTTADVAVRAVQPTQVLYLDMQHLLSTCCTNCAFHTRLIHNFIGVLAQKNRLLNQKIHHLTQRTIRAKLLSYLSQQSTLAGSSSFAIPFNRQQLADYLSVDRSALSTELGRLRDEEILTYHKNRFTLLAPH